MYGHIVMPASFLAKSVFPLMNCFCTFVKNQLRIFVGVYFWVLSFLPLINRSISLPVPLCQLIQLSGNIRYQVEWFLPLFFFMKIVFMFSGPFSFHMNFRIILNVSTKCPAGISMGITFTLQISLGENCHLFYNECFNS